jgi:hypothetical protein
MIRIVSNLLVHPVGNRRRHLTSTPFLFSAWTSHEQQTDYDGSERSVVMQVRLLSYRYRILMPVLSTFSSTLPSKLPETTNSLQDIRSATSAPHVQTHLCGDFANAYGCLNVGGTQPKVGRRVLAGGF